MRAHNSLHKHPPPSSFSTNNSLHTSSLSSSYSNNLSLQTLIPSSAAVPVPAPTPPKRSGPGPLQINVTLPPKKKSGRKPDPKPAPTIKQQQNRAAARTHRMKKEQLRKDQNAAQQAAYERRNEALRKAALENSFNLKPRPSTALSLDVPSANASSESPVAASSDIQSPLTPAPGGCGKCVEGGSCPCVDSLIEPDKLNETSSTIPIQHLSVSSPPSHARDIPRSERLDVHALLNPASPDSKLQSRKLQDDSHSENEIDFTQAFRSTLRYDPVLGNAAPYSCGACPPDDKGNCLCRKASHAVATDLDSNTSGSISSRATSSAPGGPGSCARCQEDPKQRAWCQSVARQASDSPVSILEPGERRAKRPRLYNETISCAEAYGVYQRFSKSDTKVEPSPELAEKVLQSVRGQPKEWSALELDMGFVLSTLKDTGVRKSDTN